MTMERCCAAQPPTCARCCRQGTVLPVLWRVWCMKSGRTCCAHSALRRWRAAPQCGVDITSAIGPTQLFRSKPCALQVAGAAALTWPAPGVPDLLAASLQASVAAGWLGWALCCVCPCIPLLHNLCLKAGLPHRLHPAQPRRPMPPPAGRAAAAAARAGGPGVLAGGAADHGAAEARGATDGEAWEHSCRD